MRPLTIDGTLAAMGEAVKAARVARRMTQRQLAEKIGVHRSAVMRLEKGDPSASVATLVAALWVMGLSEQLYASIVPERDAYGAAMLRQAMGERVRGESEETVERRMDF